MSNKTEASRVTEKVATLVDSVVEREGYELVDTQFVTERGRAILRLFIDTIPPGTAERGVSVDDCTHVSRIVGDLLDVEDVIGGEYNLEVSSPGLFRPLTKPAHFERALGERVKVKTYAKVEDRRVFVGLLKAHDSTQLAIDVDGTEFTVPLAQVAKANLEPDLNAGR